MEVILLDKVQNLGNLGDKVAVKPGYGRNFLIPQGKAVAATPENIKEFEQRRAELERAAAGALGVAEARRETLEGAQITVHAHAGEEGKLFGSVGTADIAEALAAQGLEVEKKEIILPLGPLRQVGEHEIIINLHTDVKAAVTVVVEPEV